MYKLIISLTLLALAEVSYAQVSGWTLCPSAGLATIREVRVRGCTAAPCVFIRGQPHYIEVDALSHYTSATLPFATTVTFLGQTITVLDGDICDPAFGFGRCPVQPGDEINFVEEILLPGIIPTINSNAVTRVWDQQNRIALCFSLPIQVR